MSDERSLGMPDITGAVVESLRLTGFVEQSVRVGEPTWWGDVTGAQPDTRTSRPIKGELIETGPFHDQALTLSVNPGRLDWFLTRPAATEQTTGIQSVASFPEAFTLFLEPMLRWLPNSPALVRLAFGAVVLIPTEDRESGYRRLSEFLPAVRIDPVGSEDFTYQINRPRVPPELGGLRLNRISKWSVALFQQFHLGVSLSTPTVVPHAGERLSACRIELDTSTPADLSRVLPQERLADILHALANFAAEVVHRGDIP